MSIPTSETMRAAITVRADKATQHGIVYGVFYVDANGSHVLCEFDGCVSYETYATLAKAQARAVACSARNPGSYVAAPVPAGIACHVEGAIVRSGGDAIAWHPVFNGGWYEVHLDAAPVAPMPAQPAQARDARRIVSGLAVAALALAPASALAAPFNPGFAIDADPIGNAIALCAWGALVILAPAFLISAVGFTRDGATLPREAAAYVARRRARRSAGL